MPVENRWRRAVEFGLAGASIYFLYKHLFSAIYIPNLPVRRVDARAGYDPDSFKFPSEKDFAEALQKLPYLIVLHEPGRIRLNELEQRNPRSLGKKEVTFDFLVIDRELDAQAFIEVTYAQKLKGNKTRQRAGVQVSLVKGEEIPYVQINRLGIECLLEARTPEEVALVLHDLTGGLLPAHPRRKFN